MKSIKIEEIIIRASKESSNEMSDRKSNNRESGMAAKESADGNDKNKESSTTVEEAVQDYNDMKEYEGLREERRKSMEHALKETMDAFS